MLRWKEGSKFTTSAACYLGLEVTDNMVFFKTTVKISLFYLLLDLFAKIKEFSIGLGGLLS